jgi:hypothetical protein
MPKRRAIIAEDEVQASALKLRKITGIEKDVPGSLIDDPKLRAQYLEGLRKEKERTAKRRRSN